MGKRGWIALRSREGPGVERRKRLGGHDPGRNAGGKVLSQERTERLIFPRLHVTRRPVVEQAEAENMLRRVANWDGVAEFGRRADIHAELKFEIEIARGTIGRRRVVRALALTARAFERGAARNDRRGAAVIGDGHVFVVRHQRIVRPKHAAGVGRVEDRGEEVGEVADDCRQADLRLRHGSEMLTQALVAVIGAQGARERQAERGPGSRSERHEMIEPRRRAHSRCLRGNAVERRTGCRHVEDLVADRHAHPRRQSRPRAKDAERQILNREVGAGRVGAFDKTSARGIVGFVERSCHFPSLPDLIRQSMLMRGSSKSVAAGPLQAHARNGRSGQARRRRMRI
jgi:hypothetical protein